MVKEYKKVNKPSSIGSTFEPELINRLNDYSKLIEVDRTKIVSSLIEEELEGKVLTNDFIKLDKPYYFNIADLFSQKVVEATEEVPIVDDYEDIYVLMKVPNNLDKPNIKYKTYSAGAEPSKHAGIYYYQLLFGSDNFYIFYFRYDQKTNKILIQNLEEENIKYVVDASDYSEVMDYIDKQKQEYKEVIQADGDIDLNKLFSIDKGVLSNYKFGVDMNYKAYAKFRMQLEEKGRQRIFFGFDVDEY